MTDQDSKKTGGVNRRRLLKGTAAAGLAGSALTGTASATAKVITIQATGQFAEYRFTVSGEVLNQIDGGPGGEDRIIGDGRTAVGRVGGRGNDKFRFTGELLSVEFPTGQADVFVNGEKVVFPVLSNTVTVQAEGEPVEYRFRVTGQVAKGDRANPSDDIIDSNVVRGTVAGQGVDTYHYSGAITFEETDGPLTVTLDIDP